MACARFPRPKGAAFLLTLAALLLSLFAPASGGGSATARATLLKNREYQDALLKGIQGAGRSVTLSFYLFKITDTPGNLPGKIAEELVRARRRGVDVTVILEQNRGKNDTLTETNRQTAALLARGGVKVYFDSPRTTTHVKAAVIDSRYVYLGSHNLSQSALQYNNELSVMIDSPALAAEVLSYLERL